MGGLPSGFKIPDGVDGGRHMFPPDLFMVVIWTYHAMYSTFDVSCLNASNFYLNYPELVPASKNGLLSANTVYSIAYKQLGIVVPNPRNMSTRTDLQFLGVAKRRTMRPFMYTMTGWGLSDVDRRRSRTGIGSFIPATVRL